MADIITPILNIVSVLCSCSANNRCCYLLDLQENKEDLNNVLVELRATRDGVKIRVDEAENNPNELMKRTHEVDSWLQRVQTIEAEVVQVIQKADEEIQGRCFGGNCPKNCWSARKIGKLVIRELAIVKEHRSKGSFGDLACKLPPPSVQEEPTHRTVGMESMFDKVWRLLAKDEVRIMGLYGYGGVGKTTLLKQINNEFLKSTTNTSSTHGYDFVILVVVSKAVNIDVIQKEIGNRLGLPSPDSINIFNALKNKNFVLLLDDIWERVDLQSIGIPLHQKKKSKVIFTTRSEIVCGHMDVDKKFIVKCLPWDDAWTLFKEKVGNETLNSHLEVLELAKIVARECAGLPLALITIGRAMSTKKTPQEWKHAITTLQKAASDFPGMSEEVLPLLKLSYDNLRDDTIKSCFLYCALFPEDHSIDKAKLIEYWIGEGFINDFDNVDEARNYGYDVIGNLKGVCLLESGEYEETQVKMHDTIRDLALWVENEYGSKRGKFCTIMQMSNLNPKRWYNAQRIYLRFLASCELKVAPPKSPNLLTLINDYSSSPYGLSIPQNFFQFMPLLGVLDLSHSRVDTFPTSITELLELRYLNLSWTSIHELPKELGKLVKLNYLDLSYMTLLEKIASGVIGSLLELRVLNLYCSGAEWDIMEELYNLEHLNELGININTQHNLNKLLSSSNENLQMCIRRLHLCSLPSWSTTTTTTTGVDSLVKLKLLSNLEILKLTSLPELKNINMNMVVREHHNYMAVAQQQQHLRSCCFQNLSEIHIWCCNALKDLTWVGYVGNLKTLHVSACEELEEIVIVDDDFGGTTEGDEIISSSKKNKMMNNVEDVFKRLKTLDMSCLPKLMSICRIALPFPCLESMYVRSCSQLKKLPFHSDSNVNNTLQKIRGEIEWWSELQWEEEEGHNNNVKSKFLPCFYQI